MQFEIRFRHGDGDHYDTILLSDYGDIEPTFINEFLEYYMSLGWNSRIEFSEEYYRSYPDSDVIDFMIDITPQDVTYFGSGRLARIDSFKKINDVHTHVIMNNGRTHVFANVPLVLTIVDLNKLVAYINRNDYGNSISRITTTELLLDTAIDWKLL